MGGFLCDCAETDPSKAKDEWKKLLKSGEVQDAAIVDTDNRNNDTKKQAIRFLASVAILMAKDKEKKHMKKVNALCAEDDKKKALIDAEKENMRAVMKKNAMALKAANKPKKPKASPAKPPGGGGGGNAHPNADDEKASGNSAPSGNVQYVANAASNEEVNSLKEQIASLTK